jgi:transcriptional regulator with XRE-family HTH domain
MPRARHDDPPPSELVQLGRALRNLRERQGLTQIQLATEAEMSESQVSEIESGKNNPGWRILVRLVVDGLDLSVLDLASAYEEAAGEQPERSQTAV